MEYDKLGRRTVLVDPSAGTTFSSYNAFGELIDAGIDGNGDVTEYQFDALGRIVQVNSPTGWRFKLGHCRQRHRQAGKLLERRWVGIVYSYDPIGRPSYAMEHRGHIV